MCEYMYVCVSVFGCVCVWLRRDAMNTKISIHVLFSASLQMVSLSLGMLECVNLHGSQHFQVLIVAFYILLLEGMIVCPCNDKVHWEAIYTLSNCGWMKMKIKKKRYFRFFGFFILFLFNWRKFSVIYLVLLKNGYFQCQANLAGWKSNLLKDEFM